MPSNVLMFGYHQVYITHIKKAYLQGTVLLHFKHLYKVCIPERESSVCWFREFSSSVHNFGVISASPPANKCRTDGKCNLKTRDWKWWPFWQHFAKEVCFSPNKTAGLDNHPVLTCWAFQAYQFLHDLFCFSNGEKSVVSTYHCPTTQGASIIINHCSLLCLVCWCVFVDFHLIHRLLHL